MILVVDDEPTIAAAMKAILEAKGYSVSTAGSCNEALSVIVGNPPQLIFSDISMPEHSGLELLRIVRSIPAASQIPVVLVSALARDQDVQNGLRAGASAYITKPFNPPELIEAIDALLPQS